MINTIKSAKNPQMLINNMVNQNPQMKEVMKFVKDNGNDPKKAFYKMAEQKGVNPDEILNMLK